MWRDPNPTSALDDIATEFLSAHGERIPAEPGSQTFRWQRWSTKPRKPPEIYVPVASFIDIPRAPALKPPAEVRSCVECGGRCCGTRCRRCRQRQVRADFILACNNRRGNAQGIFQAMVAQAAWEGSKEDGTLQRVVVAPDFEEEEIPPALVEMFCGAMEGNVEPEVFRDILIDAGFSAILEAWDARRADKERRRAARLAERAEAAATPPALYTGRPAAARALVAEMFKHPRFVDGRRFATRCAWTNGEIWNLQVLLRARATPDFAAWALGRSPASIAWRAYQLGFRVTPDWRALLKLSKAEARHV